MVKLPSLKLSTEVSLESAYLTMYIKQFTYDVYTLCVFMRSDIPLHLKIMASSS